MNFPCIFPKMSIHRKAGHPNLAKTLAWMSTFFICFTVRIKCRDLVKKIAIYRHRLAVSIEIICSFCLLITCSFKLSLLVSCSFLDICSLTQLFAIVFHNCVVHLSIFASIRSNYLTRLSFMNWTQMIFQTCIIKSRYISVFFVIFLLINY